MNKLLALFTFLFCNLASQAYEPFIEKDKFFDVGTYDETHICQWSDYLPNRYFFKGDSTINGKVYAKVYSYKMLGQQPYCPPFTIDTVSSLASFFIREDTLAKQVYKWIPNNVNEALLFDFSKVKGDTVYLEGTPSSIDSVSQIVTLDGITRQKFWLQGFNSYYIEGIGGNRGPFNPPVADFEVKSFTMCLKKKGQAILGDNCYDFVTTVKLTQKEKIVLTPNPVRNILSFNTLNPVQYQIQNVQGKLIVSGFATNVDVSLFDNGHYFIRMTTEHGPSFIRFTKN